MNNVPLISVVVPSYNHEEFITECITSILNQDYSNIEIIIVDDCSTDNSFELISSKLADKISCADNINKYSINRFDNNEGAHEAINYGIDHSTGEYVTLINSDDIYFENRLSSLYKLVSQSDADFAFSKVCYIDQEGNGINDLFCSKFQSLQESIFNYPSVSFSLLSGQAAITSGNFFFSRKLYELTGPFRPLKYCHDWDFILRASTYFEPVYLDEILYKYRLHELNTFNTLGSISEEETEKVLTSFFAGNITNDLCPARGNWPVIYDAFVERFGYRRYID